PLPELRVERTRGRQVVAERLLDDHAPPSVVLVRQARRGEAIDDRAEQIRRNGEVEQVVCRDGETLAQVSEHLLQSTEQRRTAELAGDVIQPVFDPLPLLGL